MQKGLDAIGNGHESQTLEQAIKKDFDNEIDISVEELNEYKDDLIKSFSDQEKKDEAKTLSILKYL